jgi:hypothetical protein
MRRAHCVAASQAMSVRLPALKKIGPSPLPIKLYRCARDILNAEQNSGTVYATLFIWVLLPKNAVINQLDFYRFADNPNFLIRLLAKERRIFTADAINVSERVS